MSELSYLEKLLDGVEVEWKSLGDVVNFQRGRRLVKSQLETRGKYAVYQNSMTPLGYYHEYNVAAQSSFIICAGAAGEIGYSENEFWAADDVHFAITPEYINDRFLFHFLLTQKNKISGQVRRASIPRLSKSVIEKLEFPIPCPDNPEKSLAIQSEIVRILDKFSELTAELTAELNMRKKQYNYYRDQLLSFDESSVEWKTLLEACDYVDYRGKTPKKTQSGIFLVTAKNIRMGYIDYHASQEFISEEDYAIVMRRGLPKKGDVLITTEAPCGFVAQVNRENIALAQRVIKYRSKNTQLSNSFLKHYLLGSQFQDKLMQAATGSTVKGIKGSRLHQLKIPIPSKVEQDRIVAILDKFDTLTNSITEGLPREIELRQKQYEYYRDLLFNFPKPETVSN
ncbi:restriction endonuclease subunit S [Escherichia coli]|uniref:restriction endonuclease subunit S n=1 Tax=Escherichia coli TaxID=562 RepID=UPI001D0CDB19|nr:restriction endonuclease subunit S [Escherichia coli]MDZ9264314.1 restriction endonuclease subunit S [Escherichia coli]